MKREIGIFIAGAALVLEGCSNISLPRQSSAPETPSQTPSEAPTAAPSLASPGESIPLPVIMAECQKDNLDGSTGPVPLEKGHYLRIGGTTKTGEEDLVDIIFDEQGVVTFRPENLGLQSYISNEDGRTIFADENLLIDLKPSRQGSGLSVDATVVCADRIKQMAPSPGGPQG